MEVGGWSWSCDEAKRLSLLWRGRSSAAPGAAFIYLSLAVLFLPLVHEEYCTKYIETDIYIRSFRPMSAGRFGVLYSLGSSFDAHTNEALPRSTTERSRMARSPVLPPSMLRLPTDRSISPCPSPLLMVINNGVGGSLGARALIIAQRLLIVVASCHWHTARRYFQRCIHRCSTSPPFSILHTQAVVRRQGRQP